MSERIIKITLLGDNHQPGPGVIARGSNSFLNVNLLETMYPANISYSKSFICIDTVLCDIGEVIPSLQISCQGLTNNYEYVVNDGIKMCEPSNILDILIPISDLVNARSKIEYKSSSDKWQEISVGNLTNFTLILVKDSLMLFDTIFVTIKIKLIE